jgi:hypothetical protein
MDILAVADRIVSCLTGTVGGIDQISIKTPILNVSFSLKLSSKGTWRQVFTCLRPPPLLGYVLGGKQFCRFGIWSNTNII